MIKILFLAIEALGAHVSQANDSISQNDQALQVNLRAVEIFSQYSYFYLGLIGAAVAFLINRSNNIKELFRSECNCFWKASFVLMALSFLSTSLILLRNQMSLFNMFRNGGPDLSMLINENAFIPVMVPGLVIFIAVAFKLDEFQRPQ